MGSLQVSMVTCDTTREYVSVRFMSAVKNAAIPKIKVSEHSLKVLQKAYKKAKGTKSTDYTFSAWVREACREKASRELKNTERQLFPWLYD